MYYKGPVSIDKTKEPLGKYYSSTEYSCNSAVQRTKRSKISAEKFHKHSSQIAIISNAIPHLPTFSARISSNLVSLVFFFFYIAFH